MKHRILLASSWCLVAGAMLSNLAGVAQESTKSTSPERLFNPRQVIPRAMPAIVKAPVIRGDQAGEVVQHDEIVLGVVVGDEARAYPINMLTGPRREIINDTLGGRAIAATW